MKNTIAIYQRVRQVMDKQVRIVDEYKKCWSIVQNDEHFSDDERTYMAKVYSGIMDESIKNLDQILIVVNSFKTQMSDGKRLEIIEQAASEVDQTYFDLKQFNTQTEERQRDAILEQADQALLKVISLGLGETEETLVLEAYIANARLAVKPMARYKKYGDIFDNKLESATKLNPNNPRIYFLKGLSTYHTPKAFGGGVSRTLPFFEKASAFFSNEQQEDITKPFWGRRTNAYYLHECKSSK